MCAYTGKPLKADSPNFWKNIDEAITNRGLSTRELQARTKVNKSTISRWRQPTNNRAIDVEAVRKVAALLGTTAEELLDLPSPETPSPEPPPPPKSPAPPPALLDEIAKLERTVPRLREIAEGGEEPG